MLPAIAVTKVTGVGHSTPGRSTTSSAGADSVPSSSPVVALGEGDGDSLGDAVGAADSDSVGDGAAEDSDAELVASGNCAGRSSREASASGAASVLSVGVEDSLDDALVDGLVDGLGDDDGATLSTGSDSLGSLSGASTQRGGIAPSNSDAWLVVVSSLAVLAASALGDPARRDIAKAEEVATQVMDFRKPPIMHAR